MSAIQYGYTRTLPDTTFDEAVDRITETLSDEGFGILTEIDVKATLKKKLDVDFKNYKILGACNPNLAHEALTSEEWIGLVLPCNVVVTEDGDGNASVGILKPREMFRIVDAEGMESLVDRADEKLQRALENI